MQKQHYVFKVERCRREVRGFTAFHVATDSASPGRRPPSKVLYHMDRGNFAVFVYLHDNARGERWGNIRWSRGDNSSL